MKKLLIVWKSNHEVDVHNFVIPYTYNAKVQEWFDHVELLIWGASQELVRDTPLIQERVKNLIKNEIPVYACKMCARNTDALEVLESIGVDVRFAGDLLSDALKDPETEVLTI